MVHLLGLVLRTRLVYLSLLEEGVGFHFHLRCCCCWEGRLHCWGHLVRRLHLPARQASLGHCRASSHVDCLSLDLKMKD